MIIFKMIINTKFYYFTMRKLFGYNCLYSSKEPPMIIIIFTINEYHTRSNYVSLKYTLLFIYSSLIIIIVIIIKIIIMISI